MSGQRAQAGRTPAPSAPSVSRRGGHSADTSASANLNAWVGAPRGVKARMARAGSPPRPRVILRRRGAGVKGQEAGREERRRARGGAGEASASVSSGRAT